MDGRSERRSVARKAIEIHQRDLADALLQHRNARIADPLPLFGGFVFRVLTQVAVLARTLDFSRELDLQLALERRDFVVESLENPVLHDEIDFNILVSGWWLVVRLSSRLTAINHNHQLPTNEGHLQSPESDRRGLSRTRAG